MALIKAIAQCLLIGINDNTPDQGIGCDLSSYDRLFFIDHLFRRGNPYWDELSSSSIPKQCYYNGPIEGTMGLDLYASVEVRPLTTDGKIFQFGELTKGNKKVVIYFDMAGSAIHHVYYGLGYNVFTILDEFSDKNPVLHQLLYHGNWLNRHKVESYGPFQVGSYPLNYNYHQVILTYLQDSRNYIFLQEYLASYLYLVEIHKEYISKMSEYNIDKKIFYGGKVEKERTPFFYPSIVVRRLQASTTNNYQCHIIELNPGPTGMDYWIHKGIPKIKLERLYRKWPEDIVILDRVVYNSDCYRFMCTHAAFNTDVRESIYDHLKLP